MIAIMDMNIINKEEGVMPGKYTITKTALWGQSEVGSKDLRLTEGEDASKYPENEVVKMLLKGYAVESKNFKEQNKIEENEEKPEEHKKRGRKKKSLF